MKNIFIALVLISVSCCLQAQEGRLKKADKYFEGYTYSEAIKKYEHLEEKNTDVYRKLGLSHWNLHHYLQAEEYYSKVVTQPDVQVTDYLNYAEILKNNKKYDEANVWMEKYYTLNPKDKHAENQVKHKEYIKELLSKETNFSNVKDLDVNSAQQDFGASFYMNDKVVFASSREGINPIDRKWNWNGLPFLDLYMADKSETGELNNPSQFIKKLNLKYHEGPCAFTEDGNFMIFTRSNYTGKDDDGVIKLMMFTSEKVNDEWSEEKGLPINSDLYSIGHPSLTPDGSTLYFSSDMEGGKGGSDLYKIQRFPDGAWGDPVNLGDEVNTEGNEMFPFYHQSGVLFFSSNGLPGLGGLDNFMVPITNGKISGYAVNLGVPLNSSTDDFAVVINKEMKKGYFSSNREGGKGSDDIYSFDVSKPVSFNKIIKGVDKSKKGELLSAATVKLFDEKGQLVQEVLANNKGEYSFVVEPNKKFSLTGVKEDYFDGKNTANTTTKEDIVIANLELVNDPGLSLYCLVTDAESKKAVEGVKLVLTNLKSGESEEFVTSINGDFTKSLNKAMLNETVEYDIAISKPGYLTKTVKYSKLLSESKQYNLHEEIDFSIDKIQVGTDLAKILDIKPIYFDLGKYNIRKDAAVELDKIVKVMNENPSMEVELGSHTDCRGSVASNEKLSDNRAKSSAQYIKERIIGAERIFGKGYGESVLVNHCECEGSKMVTCTEEEHQQNRRTEFKIIKM